MAMFILGTMFAVRERQEFVNWGAQEPQSPDELYWMYHSPKPLKLPDPKLTVAEIVDIMADFSLKHQEDVGAGYAGRVEPTDRMIWIADKYDMTTRKQSVIHEWLHVYWWKRGVATGGFPAGETAIELQSTKIYNELFGDQEALKALETKDEN